MDTELLQEGIIPLLEAFKNFEKNSNNWQILYKKLQKSFDGLRAEFEQQNYELKESFKKNLVLKKYLHQIIDNIDVAIIVYNTKKEIVFVNHTATNFFEREIESLVGKNIEKTLNSWYGLTNLEKTFVAEKNYIKESAIYKDYFLEYSNICIFSERENNLFDDWLGVIQICHDVSTIQKKQHKKYLTQKETSLNLMMSNIAHEIKNPLLGITTYLDELNNLDCNKNNQKANELLQKSKKGIGRINKIIRSVIDFDKFVQPTFVRYDLKKVINYIIEKLEKDNSIISVENNPEKDIFKKEPIRLFNKIDQEQLFIDMDIFSIKSAIVNIISNSIDSIEQSGKIVISAEYNSWRNRCSLFIYDNGKTIEEKNTEFIFDPFFTTYPNKIGLGLTYAKKIVEYHNGNIKVESSREKGTIFEIELPIMKKEFE